MSQQPPVIRPGTRVAIVDARLYHHYGQSGVVESVDVDAGTLRVNPGPDLDTITLRPQQVTVLIP